MQKMVELESFVPKVHRLNTLIESYASAQTGQDQFLHSLKRQADQLKRLMMGCGWDAMGQLSGAIGMAAARAGNAGQKTRILRENIGSLKHQLELAMRIVVREDEMARAKEEKKDGEQDVSP